MLAGARDASSAPAVTGSDVCVRVCQVVFPSTHS